METYAPLRAIAIVALLAAPSTAWAQAESTALRMQRVVAQYCQQTGNQILGIGSWISGRNYNDVLRVAEHASDHDMRLVLRRGASDGRALSAWQAAKRRLTRLIHAEFGDDAARVIAETNLYPPTQLMRGVRGPADAISRFRYHGVVPRLDHAGAVSAETAQRCAEGLYGPGADAYTQHYEREAGRLWYRSRGRVYSGLPDLIHYSEEYAQYTISGTANTAVQWTCKAQHALGGNNSRAVVKTLQRYLRAIGKCRALARRAADTPLTNQLRTMLVNLENNPRLLHSSRGAIRQLIARAQMHASLLRQLEHPNPIRRGIARLTLDAVDAKNAVGRQLTKICEKLPPDVAIRGVFFAIGLALTSRSLGEEDMLSAYNHALTTAHSTVAAGATAAELMAILGPAAMLAITQSILEGARKGGYEWVAGRQEAFDLLDGVFSTTGVDQRRYSLDQLVRHFRTEAALQAFVLARAHQAADRGFGPANRQHDVQTADAIYRKCYPIISYAWHEARAALTMELWKIIETIEHNSVVLTYEPYPPVLRDGMVRVTVRAEPTDPDEGAKLRRSRELLRILLGANKRIYAVTTTTWTPRGAGDPERPAVRSFRLPAGVHQVTYEVMISIGEASLPYRSKLRKTIRRRAMVRIPISRRETPVVKPPPVEPGKPWRPPLPTVTATRLGKRWTIDGPYSGSHHRMWNTRRDDNTPRGISVRAFGVYTDHPDGAASDTWRWSKKARTVIGMARTVPLTQRARPIQLPYGDARWKTWESSDARQHDVVLVARWGELLFEVTASGQANRVTMGQVLASARHVLDDVARQLEARRPKKR